MPAPRDPLKRQQWLDKLSLAAKNAGFGKANKLTKDLLTTEQREAISIRAKAVCTPEERERRRQRALSQGFGKSNKGRSLTEDHKRAMVAALKGKSYEQIYGDKASLQKETRRVTNLKTYAPRIKQDKATRNKHGADAAYRAWRTSVFERDDWTCQHCLVRGGSLHAHHILPWAKYESERYNIANGMTLCELCHTNHHRSK